jgi:hypothetical protein
VSCRDCSAPHTTQNSTTHKHTSLSNPLKISACSWQQPAVGLFSCGPPRPPKHPSLLSPSMACCRMTDQAHYCAAATAAAAAPALLWVTLKLVLLLLLLLLCSLLLLLLLLLIGWLPLVCPLLAAQAPLQWRHRELPNLQQLLLLPAQEALRPAAAAVVPCLDMDCCCTCCCCYTRWLAVAGIWGSGCCCQAEAGQTALVWPPQTCHPAAEEAAYRMHHTNCSCCYWLRQLLEQHCHQLQLH